MGKKTKKEIVPLKPYMGYSDFSISSTYLDGYVTLNSITPSIHSDFCRIVSKVKTRVADNDAAIETEKQLKRTTSLFKNSDKMLVLLYEIYYDEDTKEEIRFQIKELIEKILSD